MKVTLLKMQSKRRGGLEKYAQRIAASFMKRGDEVTFLTTELPQVSLSGINYSLIHVSHCWPSFVRLEQFDKRVRTWLETNPSDIVFGMERNRSQTHLRAGNGVHAAYLESRRAEGRLKYELCRINPLHRKILELEQAAFESPNLKKIFVNSCMVRNDILTHYAVDPEKIELIYNGVEWAENGAAFSSWKVRRKAFFERFRLKEDLLHLLFIGNGYERKGLKPLLQALSLWKFKDFHLSVVGKEKKIDKYRALRAELGLEGRVRFFGPQNETVPFYQMADTLIVPSYYDPFANVTLEALSFGLFVVSSKTNGGHEILTQENGSVIETLDDPESILTALDPSKLRKTMAQAEKIRPSISHLDFSNQLEKLLNACD